MQLLMKNIRHTHQAFVHLIFALLLSGLFTLPASAKSKDTFPERTTPMVELQTKCKAGNLNYCGRIALNYQYGNLVDKDEVKGFNLLNKYCEQGNMESCSSVGFSYYHGYGARKDEQKAALYTSRACYGNNASACANLGYYYSAGIGVEKNKTKAYAFNKKACDLGLVRGCSNQAANLYGGIGVERDTILADQIHYKACADGPTCIIIGTFYKALKKPKKALEFFNMGCEDFSDGKSCAEMAYFYESKRNYELGMESHDKGCDLGFVHSCGVIGYYYKEGWGVEINYSRALKLLIPACENETPDFWSCKQAGRIYEDANIHYRHSESGDLVDRQGNPLPMSADRTIVSDGKKSAYFYNLACNGGQSSACSSLGFDYQMGRHGLKENQRLATKAYLKGCELKGDCYEAAKRLFEGKGIAKNIEKAMTLFEQACEKKSMESCYQLGLAYQIGEHRQKNIETAQQFYEDGCNQLKHPYSTVACTAVASIYNNKNKFPKADKILKALCKRESKGTSCETQMYFSHEHLCNLGQKKSCDIGYVGSLIEAQKKTLNDGYVAPVAPRPSYTPPAFTPKPIISKPQKGCDGLSSPACFALAKDYLRVEGNVSKDARKARNMFVKTCNKGHSNSCMFAGQTYSSSDYELKGAYSMSKARSYYIKACDLGKADGCTSAASTYPRSDVYDEDKLPLYERACNMGNRGGCNGVDRINNTGDYAPR